MENTQAVKIFISYAAGDAVHRDNLTKHLAALRRSGKVTVWNDNQITPGQDWDEAIRQHLRQADIVALLLSGHFMASDHIWENELKISLERREKGEAVMLIPILVDPCMLENTFLEKIQRLPRNQKAVSQQNNVDESWYLIVKEIDALVDNFSKTVAAAAAQSAEQQMKPDGVQQTSIIGSKNVISGSVIIVKGNMYFGDGHSLKGD